MSEKRKQLFSNSCSYREHMRSGEPVTMKNYKKTEQALAFCSWVIGVNIQRYTDTYVISEHHVGSGTVTFAHLPIMQLQ